MAVLGDFLSGPIWKISWQTAVLAAVIWLISRFARRAPASWRHALWLVVLFKLFIPPFAQLPAQLAFWQIKMPTVAQQVTVKRPAPHSSTSVSRPSSVTPWSLPAISEPAVTRIGHTAGPEAKGILAAAWVTGFIVMLTLLLLRLLRQGRLIRNSVPASGEIAYLLERSAASLGMRRLPKPRTSPEARTPMLIGLWRPTVVLPSSIMNSCTESELSAMLLHELAHAKRLDIACMWLYQLAQLLFFFHPAVWLAGLELKRERELACDELVLSKSAISPRQYAAGYVSALKLARSGSGTATAVAMTEPFEMEKRRLKMIFRGSLPKISTGWTLALALIAAVGFPTFAGVMARPSSPPKKVSSSPLPIVARNTRSSVQTTPREKAQVKAQSQQSSPIRPVVAAKALSVTAPKPEKPQVVKPMPAGDELEWILQGRRQALKSIRSGKGRVARHFLHRRSDGVTETDDIYDTAFIDEKFRVSLETRFLQNGPADDPSRFPAGSKRAYADSYDGKRAVSYSRSDNSCMISERPNSRERKILDMLVREPMGYFMAGDHVDALYGQNAVKKSGLHVVRHETIDGDECAVLQLSWVEEKKDGSPVSWTWEFWVSPGKGFSVPKVVGYGQGGWFGKKRYIITQLDTEVRRQRDGMWVPAKFTSSNYQVSKEGKRTLGLRHTLTFDPGFGFNVPVTDADLKITLPVGTNVNDTVMDAIYQVDKPRTV